jgi:hypothetical protein
MALSYLYAKKDDVKKHMLGLDISDLPSSLDAAIESKYLVWAQRDIDTYCGQNFDQTVTEEYYDGSGTNMLILRRRPVREILRIRLDIIPPVEWVRFKRWFYIQTQTRTGITVARAGGVEPAPVTSEPPYVFPAGLGFITEDSNPVNQTATFSNTDTQYERVDLLVNCEMGMLQIPARVLFMEGQATPFWNYTWLRGNGNVRIKYSYGYTDPATTDNLIGGPGNLPPEITDAAAMWACKYILMDKAVTMGAGAKSLSVDGVSRSFGEMPYEGVIKMLDERAKSIMYRYKMLGV